LASFQDEATVMQSLYISMMLLLRKSLNRGAIFLEKQGAIACLRESAIAFYPSFSTSGNTVMNSAKRSKSIELCVSN
jgi:hypothetical protein